MQHYRTIWISDVHLGSKACQAAQLVDFLKHNTADTIYLIGDIIDGWKVTQNKWRWNKEQGKVVRKLLKLSNKCKIIYIPGNHDEFLRPLCGHNFNLNGLELHHHYVHTGVDGKQYLVTHGDLFDGITRLAPWIAFFGDKAYDIVVSLNSTFNAIRHRLGFGYWSLAKFLKRKVKKAASFIFDFEKNLVGYCKHKGYAGTICGHIHTPEIKEIDGLIYMNDGDWCETCSALVEHTDGRFELIYWTKVKDEETSAGDRRLDAADQRGGNDAQADGAASGGERLGGAGHPPWLEELLHDPDAVLPRD